jgi:hypothetical protein
MIIEKKATIALSEFEKDELSAARRIIDELIENELLDEYQILGFLTAVDNEFKTFYNDKEEFNIEYEI